MDLEGRTVGFAVTGSHCSLEEVMPEVQRLVDEGAKVIPIASLAVTTTDTRFGVASEWISRLERITSQTLITTIKDAEPIGPKGLLDVLVIAPCTGNTIAKLAVGISDSAVLMAAKCQFRNQRPVVMAVSTNDGLGMNAKNVGILLNSKNVYMVPFGQDDPYGKANSLKAHAQFILPTVLAALEGRQLQPVLKGFAV